MPPQAYTDFTTAVRLLARSRSPRYVEISDFAPSESFAKTCEAIYYRIPLVESALQEMIKDGTLEVSMELKNRFLLTPGAHFVLWSAVPDRSWLQEFKTKRTMSSTAAQNVLKLREYVRREERTELDEEMSISKIMMRYGGSDERGLKQRMLQESFAPTRQITSRAAAVKKRRISEIITISDDSDSDADILNKRRSELKRAGGVIRTNKKLKVGNAALDLPDDNSTDDDLSSGSAEPPLANEDGSLKVVMPFMFDGKEKDRVEKQAIRVMLILIAVQNVLPDAKLVATYTNDAWGVQCVSCMTEDRRLPGMHHDHNSICDAIIREKERELEKNRQPSFRLHLPWSTTQGSTVNQTLNNADKQIASELQFTPVRTSTPDYMTQAVHRKRKASPPEARLLRPQKPVTPESPRNLLFADDNVIVSRTIKSQSPVSKLLVSTKKPAGISDEVESLDSRFTTMINMLDRITNSILPNLTSSVMKLESAMAIRGSNEDEFLGQINTLNREVANLKSRMAEHEQEGKDSRRIMSDVRKDNVNKVTKLQLENNRILQSLMDRLARLERVLGYAGESDTSGDDDQNMFTQITTQSVAIETSRGRKVKAPERFRGYHRNDAALKAIEASTKSVRY